MSDQARALVRATRLAAKSKVIADRFSTDSLVVRVARLVGQAEALTKSVKGGKGPSRFPAGSGKGGQFAPKGGAGGGYSMFGPSTPKPKASPAAPPKAQQPMPSWLASGKAKAVVSPAQGALPFPSAHAVAPKAPPPGSVPHLKTDDAGQTVHIHKPDQPSSAETWHGPIHTAVFTPGSKVPAAINGVALAPWTPPATKAGWAAVEGQKAMDEPPLPAAVTKDGKPKRPGAGVVVVEPDGRVWVVGPTNEFGGYKNSFPKGGAEGGLSLQANAIKEAYEESGLKVAITGHLGDYEGDTSISRYYTAKRTGGTPADMGWESQAVRLVPALELYGPLNRDRDRKIADDLFTRLDAGDVHKRLQLLLDRLEQVEKTKKHGKTPSRFDPNQPRWPAGTPLAGQWKSKGLSGLTMPPHIAAGAGGKNPAYQLKADAAYAHAKAGDLTALDKLHADMMAKAVKVDAKEAAGIKLTSHDKWTNQTAQYIDEVHQEAHAKAVQGLPTGSTTTPQVNAALTKGPMSLASMKHVGAKPGGSSAGGVYVDANGEKWLVKGYANGAGSIHKGSLMASNEVLAARLYGLAGVAAPEMRLVDLGGEHGGGIGVASKWVDGKFEKLNPADPIHVAAMRKGFGADAWLANWDAVGMSYDNTVINSAGQAVRIDPGGSMLFRAQGQEKGAQFGTSVGEIDSLRGKDPKVHNPTAAAMFGGMTQSAITASLEPITKLDNDEIRALVDRYGPGDAADKKALADKLVARKEDIATKLAIMNAGSAPTPQPAPVASPAPSTAPVAPAQTGSPAKPSYGAGFFGSHYSNVTDAFDTAISTGDFALAEKLANPTVSPIGAQHSDYKKFKAYTDAALANAKQNGTATATVVQPSAAPAQPTFSNGNPSTSSFYTALTTSLDSAIASGSMQAATNLAAFTPHNIATAPPDANYLEYKAYATAALAHAKQNTQAPTAQTPPTAQHLSHLTPSAANKPIVVTGSGKFQNVQDDIDNIHQAAMKGDGSLVSFVDTNTTSGEYYKAAVMISLGLGNEDTGTGSANEIWSGVSDSLKSKIEAAHGPIMPGGWIAKPPSQATASFNQSPALPAPRPPAAPAAAPVAPPALPDFNSAKLPASNSNAKSVNAKLDAIAAAAAKGDVNAILAMGFGSNNYAAAQVKLANDALAALGSTSTVAKSQKPGTHPDLGKTPQGQVAAAIGQAHASVAAHHKAQAAKFDSNKLSAPPDFHTIGAGGKPMSSVPAVNDANNAAVNHIHAIAVTGDLGALQAATFQPIDKATGLPVGAPISYSQHPSQHVKAYFANLTNEVDIQLNPPTPPVLGTIIPAKDFDGGFKHLPPVPAGKHVAAIDKAQKQGYYIALGKVESPAKPASNDTAIDGGTWTGAAKAAWNAAPSEAQATFYHYKTTQGAKELNTALRVGDLKTVTGGKTVQKHLEDFEKLLVDVPEGSTFVRNMGDHGYGTKPDAVVIKQLENFLMSAEPGTVIQEPGFTSSSHGTAILGHNNIQWKFTAAKGVKVYPGWLTGNTGEGEGLFPPNQRYMIHSAKKHGKTVVVEATLLPTLTLAETMALANAKP